VDQSLDRAFRIGQTKNVICYFPLFDNTIDTIVYEVLDKKRDIINMAIDGVIDNKGVIEEVIDRLDEKFKK
jgi:SNF2 family DNA or RNA helicase